MVHIVNNLLALAGAEIESSVVTRETTIMEPTKPETATQPTSVRDEAGTPLKLTAKQKALVEGWEIGHGRKMTDQEIRFAVEVWNKTVGEL
jgi:hypothetical protein